MRKKRILAVLLSSAIAFSGMPGNVFAAEDIALEKEFSDGADVTEDVTEESIEGFTGFSDRESESFVIDEEMKDETDPETQVFADVLNVAESGKCGDNLTYTITGDETNGYTLTISGMGDMYNYSWYEEKAVPRFCRDQLLYHEQVGKRREHKCRGVGENLSQARLRDR